MKHTKLHKSAGKYTRNFFIIRSFESGKLIVGYTTLPIVALFDEKLIDVLRGKWVLLYDRNMQLLHAKKLYRSIKENYCDIFIVIENTTETTYASFADGVLDDDVLSKLHKTSKAICTSHNLFMHCDDYYEKLVKGEV